MNLFPPSPRVSHWDRFEFIWTFTEIFASQAAPPVSKTLAANLPPVSMTPAANFATSFSSVVDTGGKFATGVNDTSGKFAAGVKDTGGKLPPVSTTPVANCHRYQRHQRQICHQPVANCHWYQPHRWQICHHCQWHWWEIMGTISGCRHLKVNLKAKIYIYVYSTRPKVSKQNN